MVYFTPELVRSILSTLLVVVLFYFVSIPWTYQQTNKLTTMINPNWVTIDPETGMPSTLGYVLHGFVFALLTFLALAFVPWRAVCNAITFGKGGRFCM